nr:uncharacterized protein LOC109161946 [Ipomoea batatas]
MGGTCSLTIFLTVLKIFFNRSDAYYDHGFFTEHGVATLEDLVITLAEGAASMYLELIVDTIFYFCFG